MNEDWYSNESCQLIEDYILEDTNNFASFMYSLIMNLIGGEEQIQELLGFPKASNGKFDGHFLDDEDFDE